MDAPNPTQTQIHIYLAFDGTCEAAIDFYKSILGGKITMKSYFDDAPMDTPESSKGRVMHVHYSFDGCSIMASDSSGEQPVTMGNNFHVSVYLGDADRAATVFGGLSEGGQVHMPLQSVFWGGQYGSFVDKYGVQWMVSCP